MDITPLIRSDRQVIQSYSSGCFKISGVAYEGAVIVFPGHTERWAFSGSAETLTQDDLEIVIKESAGLDILLFGGGAQMAMVAPELRAELKRLGVSLECMDSGAACRTYNLLLTEGRRVAAAMLPV